MCYLRIKVVLLCVKAAVEGADEGDGLPSSLSVLQFRLHCS